MLIMQPMDDFSGEVIRRLLAMERSRAWLARRVRLKSRQALDHYLHGRRPWPDTVRHDVAVLLDIRAEAAEEAAA